MSADDFLADAATRRQVMIQRAGRGISKELEGVLGQMRDDITRRLSEASSDFQRKRLGTLLGSVESIMQVSKESISEKLTQRLNQFTDGEVEFQKETFDQVLNVETTVPAAEKVHAAVTAVSTELIAGNKKQRLTIQEMVDTFSRSSSKEIKNLISSGFIAGDTTDSIAKRVSQKVKGRTRAQARALVQTSVNHAAGVARQEFSKENADKLGGEKYLATLDARTTPTCSGLDGNIYDVGEGPRPPLHYNCRSLRVAVPREGSVLSNMEGDRPAVGAGGVEQVSSKKTFSGWLKGQPEDFKREFFRKYENGQAKYELFEKGGLDAKDFIDADGVEISLDELKQSNPLAWQKAGVGSGVFSTDTASTATPNLTTGQRLAQAEFDIGQNLGRSQRNKVNSLFGGSEKVRQVAMATGDYPRELNFSSTKKLGSGKAYYRPADNSITTIDNKTVFTHEYGHYVDFNARQKVAKDGIQGPLSAKRRLTLELKKDATRLDIKPGATSNIRAKANQIKEKHFVRKGRTYEPKTDGAATLSDIYDAATAGEMQGLGLYGHGTKYYSSNDMRATETFANMFALHETELWPEVKVEFPNASARFEEILDEIINRD